MIRLQAVRERLRLSLWFLPAVFALAAVDLAVLLAAAEPSARGHSLGSGTRSKS